MTEHWRTDDTDPEWYGWHPLGIKAISIAEAFSCNLGSAILHIWRAGRKPGEPAIADLRKAVDYLNHEIARLQRPETSPVTGGEQITSPA